MKIVSINYFNQVLDQVALEAYKQTAEYQEAVERCEGDWAFSRYQDEVENNFTSIIPTSEGNPDVAIDYAIKSECSITCYIRNDSASVPVVRFKFANAKLTDADRELTSAEKELLSAIIDEFKLVDVEL